MEESERSKMQNGKCMVDSGGTRACHLVPDNGKSNPQLAACSPNDSRNGKSGHAMQKTSGASASDLI